MARGHTVDLEFRANLDQMIAQLRTLPDATGKEAKAMAKAIEKQLKKTVKEAEKAGKKMGSGFKKGGKNVKSMSDQVERADSALKQLAGGIGRISPATETALSGLGDMAGSLAIMMSPIGAAVGALALLSAGVLAVSAGLIAATLKADDFLEELDELRTIPGFLPEIDQSKIDAMERANAAITGIKKAAMAAAVIIGIEFAPVVETLATGLLMGAIVAKRLADRVSELDGTLLAVTPHIEGAAVALGVLAGHPLAIAHGLGRLGGKALGTADAFQGVEDEAAALIARIRELTDETEESDKAFGSATDAIDELITSTARMIPRQDIDKVSQLNAQLDLLGQAAFDSAENAERLAPSIVQVADAINTIQAAEAAAEMSALIEQTNKLAPPDAIDRLAQLRDQLDKIHAAMREGKGDADQLAAAAHRVGDAMAAEWDEVEAKTKDMADSADREGKRWADAWRRHIQSVASQMHQGLTNMTSAISNFASLAVQNAYESGSEELEARAETIAELEAQLEEAQAARDEMYSDEAEGVTDRDKQVIDDQIAGIQERLGAEKAASKTIEKEKERAILKAWNVQQAANISEAIMNTALAITQVMGIPPPVGPILAATVAALGASQVALISAAEPPSFHSGGMIGDQMIRARVGEGVLTPQGVNAIGGPSGLDAANRGGGAQPLIVQQVYKHRVLDSVLSDSITRGGPISRAINSRTARDRGRRNPYRRAG